MGTMWAKMRGLCSLKYSTWWALVCTWMWAWTLFNQRTVNDDTDIVVQEALSYSEPKIKSNCCFGWCLIELACGNVQRHLFLSHAPSELRPLEPSVGPRPEKAIKDTFENQTHGVADSRDGHRLRMWLRRLSSWLNRDSNMGASRTSETAFVVWSARLSCGRRRRRVLYHLLLC